MKKILFLALIAAAFLTACDRIDNTDLTPKATVLTGTIVPATRTTLVEAGDDYALNWVAGDRISVSNGTATALYEAVAGGSTTAEFSPVGDALEGASFTALYPETLAEGILSATQNYAEGDILGMPMTARSDADPTHLLFSPASGILRINVATEQSDILVSAIQVDADQPMSGTILISNGTLAVTEGSGVTLSCSGGVAIGAQPKAFHIHVPAGSYTGLVIRLIATDGREYVARLDGADTYRVVRGELNTLNIASALFTAPTSTRRAVLRVGSDVNELMKQLSSSTAKCSSANSTIKKIVFKVNQPGTGTTLVSKPGTEPVWISLDAGSGTLTFSTRADQIYTNVNASYLFSRLNALTGFEGLEHLNTSETEYFSGMFFANAAANPALTTLDLRTFDTRNALSLTSMFDSLVNLRSVDLSSFETSKCRSFASMFNYCKSLESVDLLHFNTSSCETLYRMFQYCNALEEIDLHNWDLSKVTSMNRIFLYCTSLKRLDLGGDGCSTASLTSSDYFINACNVIREVRLGKNFKLENFTGMPSYFFAGIGYIKTTVEEPMVFYTTPDFCQKSLRGSPQALRHTNDRVMVWKDIETGEAFEFNQPVGSLTSTVRVKGVAGEMPQMVLPANDAAELLSAIDQAVSSQENYEYVIKLNSDIQHNAAISLANTSGRPVTLDLNGHILSTSIQTFISAVSGEWTFTDTGAPKGKISSSESLALVFSGSSIVNVADCVIESTKATGASWNNDAVVSCIGTSSTSLISARIYATGKMTVIRMNNSGASLTIGGETEISSGTASAQGYYGIVNLAGNLTINSGSIWTKSVTSGTAPSALHHGGANANSTVNGGYLYSAGARTVSAGGTYITKITLAAGYYNQAPSTYSGSGVTYAPGKILLPADPVETRLHETTGETLSYGYTVGADPNATQ